MKAVIIDDEPLARSIVKEYLQSHPEIEVLQECNDGFEGVKAINQHEPDLIFLDIQMPKINGFEMLELIENPPNVIFTTAFEEFAIKAFETHAVDYLLKPFDFDRFSKAVSKAITQLEKNREIKPSEEGIFVRSEYQLVKIDLDKIEYIESVEDYIKIHQTVGSPIMTLMTLKTFAEKLPTDKFVRIHRSYIVPVAKIQGLNSRMVQLSKTELPVSKTYFDELKHRLNSSRP